MFPNDYFSPEDQGPEREEPEKTGPRRFFGLLLTESGALLKLNLLFILTCIPLVTIPPAALALSRVVRGLLDDKPGRAYAYWAEFKRCWAPGWGAFLLTALPLFSSGYGMVFYMSYAGTNWIAFVPFVICTTVFLTVMQGTTYLWGLLALGRGMSLETVRLALALGLGKPLRGALAAAAWYLPLAAAVLFFPLSMTYLLLLGFSVPCLLSHFYLRTVLRALPD